MHGYHSNPSAPPYDEFVAFAREQGLDFFPLTEYVVGVHWGQLGPYQRANPDVLFWPGREIITYFGHVLQFGATPEPSSTATASRTSTSTGSCPTRVDAGALLGIGHPTTFEQPGFESFCRGCAWELEDASAGSASTPSRSRRARRWSAPTRARPAWRTPSRRRRSTCGTTCSTRGSSSPGVGASDDKLSGRGSGPTYTPHGVRPPPCTRASCRSPRSEAVTAGHVYVRTRGVARLPRVDIEVGDPRRSARADGRHVRSGRGRGCGAHDGSREPGAAGVPRRRSHRRAADPGDELHPHLHRRRATSSPARWARGTGWRPSTRRAARPSPTRSS